MRFLRRLRSSPHRLGKRLVGVSHFHRDIPHTVAMLPDVLRGRIVSSEWRRQYKIRLALAQCVRRALALPRFQSAVSNL